MQCHIDELYLIALQDHDKLFPISDEAYAEELQLQEILFPSSPATVVSSEIAALDVASSSGMASAIVEEINGDELCMVLEINGDSLGKFCLICMDKKPSEEFFIAKNCNHSFCVDCTSKYIATKIQENISMVKCPDSSCKGVINPSDCNEIVPNQVVERWEKALIESQLLVSETTLYCPFKDCSELLLNDEAVAGSAECPSCHRLFCAVCNVAWHNGLECAEFQRLSEADRTEGDVSAIRLAKEKEWMRCPHCRFFVDKKSGVRMNFVIGVDPNGVAATVATKFHYITIL
ncbi:hypothetical protein V2J09_011420 [Rumex salicifolius]